MSCDILWLLYTGLVITKKYITKLVKGLETMSPEEKPKELGICTQENRCSQCDMIAIFQYLKRCHEDDGVDMFSVMSDDTTWTNGYKL